MKSFHISGEPLHLIVKKSHNGKGIFTTKKILNSEIVFEIKGNLISWQKSLEIGGQTLDNTFRFSKNFYLSPEGYLGDFLNHSCIPNSKIVKERGKLFVEALKNINKGEEIVIDYSTILARDDTWTMKCNCGEINCRKIIKRLNLLPKPLFKEYKEKSIIPKFILEIK